jgi:hypothetical protein
MLEEVVAKVDLDFGYLWEDMAYKSGPLISPTMFDEFIAPYYKRIAGFLRAHGVDVSGRPFAIIARQSGSTSSSIKDRLIFDNYPLPEA